ncbi:uncharacterized protein LOC129763390 isoform X1 [Toxorhynchites rutilus septentrionalis]|uniref:uncharacterized protein LOC129763390 isoform X1 n=1 Tax=Toxorhynchites rutilus septentrionalis TaxID=329112 RepID=UPI00247B130C|nr:uncharacterized protein LOC129763390 isoform X1 [Toxorhynchites rutilus septentrionalis]
MQSASAFHMTWKCATLKGVTRTLHNKSCAQQAIVVLPAKVWSAMLRENAIFNLHSEQFLRRTKNQEKHVVIADLLHNEHGLPRELATESSTTFLASYRRCPDNPDVPLTQWRTQMWKDALPVSHKHLALQLYSRWTDYRTRYLAPSADIISMLQTLRHRYLLGIISNGSSAGQWEKIDRLALSRFFDCILVSADLPWAKPDRNIFNAACHYLGVQPEECAMIGDKLETDVQGGVESKMGATIWLPLPKDLQLMHDKTLDDLDEHIRPDFVVENVLDLLSVLPQSTGGSIRQQRPPEARRGSSSFVQKTTRNREASYNRFLPEVPDLCSSSSNSCDSTSSMESN